MFKAAKNLEKYIGGRMFRCKKGEVIDLDRETIEQNFEPGDYEEITQTADSKTKTKK